MPVAEGLVKVRLSLATYGRRAFITLMSGIETLLSLGNPNPELWANVRVTIRLFSKQQLSQYISTFRLLLCYSIVLSQQ